jgi:hypothetical protein
MRSYRGEGIHGRKTPGNECFSALLPVCEPILLRKWHLAFGREGMIGVGSVSVPSTPKSSLIYVNIALKLGTYKDKPYPVNRVTAKSKRWWRMIE